MGHEFMGVVEVIGFGVIRLKRNVVRGRRSRSPVECAFAEVVTLTPLGRGEARDMEQFLSKRAHTARVPGCSDMRICKWVASVGRPKFMSVCRMPMSGL